MSNTRTANPRAAGADHPESDPMDTAKLAAALAAHQIYSEKWTAAGGVSIVCVCTDVVFVAAPDEKNYESELNEAFAGHQAQRAVEMLAAAPQTAAAAAA